MNPLGINLWNWCPGLTGACLGLPEKAARMGFTALELPMTQPELPAGLKEEIRDTGLAVSLCAALGPGRDLSNFDPAVRERTMEYLTRCLDTGAALGASVLAGPLYAGGGKCHRLEEDEKKREWDLAVTGLRRLARRAAGCGMALALEPLNRYRTSVANTAGQVLKMVQDIGEANVGVHFDTYHACLEERDLCRALEDALASGRVNHFHACANNRGAPGQGVLPWERILGLLLRYGYAGHVTMETFAPGGLDASWVQVHPEPDQVAREGLEYLKKFFENHGEPGRLAAKERG